MELYPAIDIIGGRVSRLLRGDWDRATSYDVTPLQQSLALADAGFSNLHVVDLDGARTGSPASLDILDELIRTGLCIHYGGGLRTFAAIDRVVSAGVSRAMVGSLLFEDEKAPASVFRRYGDRVLPCVDVRNGFVAVKGWTEMSGLSWTEAIALLVGAGFTRIMVTSIERDGALGGPDTSLYSDIMERFPDIELIAAGGVRDNADLRLLSEMDLYGAVFGKSLYEGKVDLAALVKENSPC